MKTRNALPRLAWGLAIALALVMTQRLEAVTLTITATAACDQISGGFLITYTAAVTNSGGVTNPSVDILFDGTVVDNGAFEDPSFSFSNVLDGPAGKGAGDTVAVSLQVIGTWSNGVAPGDAANTASTTVTLPEEGCDPGIGRFTGGGHFTVGGAKITRGLTIHCDLLLSNNLEINWGGNGANADKFHMLEHLETVECSDDPTIGQPPPAAPLDTLVGIGTGRFNGELGYTIHFTLVDGGEPSVNDAMAILIFETANPANVILNVPLTPMAGGNLQAHYDQPHKNK